MSARQSMCCPTDASSSAEREVGAVLLDLDDTLFPQADWLSGAWDAVAKAAGTSGVDTRALRRALDAVASQGSDRGRIIDRALAMVGAKCVDVSPLVDAFRGFEAPVLHAYAGVREALRFLGSRVPVGLVTDGDPGVQRSKLRALSMQNVFDAVVFSDELGRDRRKPHPAPLIRCARLLRVDPTRCVYVGDRPDKDVAAAQAARMRAVRVRTGEYVGVPDFPYPWLTARDVPSAVDRIVPFVRGVSRAEVASRRR